MNKLFLTVFFFFYQYIASKKKSHVQKKNCEIILKKILSPDFLRHTGVSGPEKSRNNTREKISYFFTYIDVANRLPDLSRIIAARTQGGKNNIQNEKPKVPYSVALALAFLAAENENRQLENLPLADFGRLPEGLFCR